MHRRDLLKGLVLGGVVAALSSVRLVSAKTALGGTSARLAALERQHGGRLGVAILDTGSGKGAAYRTDERFQMCSTFKWLLAAAVLKRVDDGVERLDRRIVFGKDALLDWAPVTSKHAGAPGMTVAQLCEAAVTLSDNTAANLLLQSIGGPSAVTAYMRGLGDPVTRLDRTEPALNQPQGELDTTTPAAMLADMQRVLLGNALTQPSRGQLVRWMLACQTGLQSLRAGFPATWRAGDKTGQWDGHGVGINNDVAIAWPPGRKPVLVAAYYMTRSTDVAARKAVLADVGRIAASL
ncbi:MAG: class A beta-lactamase [Proteobacteria bacterium]|nr:class A beta-lactamase [Pseudomonadota bacterium]